MVINDKIRDDLHRNLDADEIAQDFIDGLNDWPELAPINVLMGIASEQELRKSFDDWYSTFSTGFICALPDEVFPVVVQKYAKFVPGEEAQMIIRANMK
jgi:hypothetical protein